MKLNSNKCSTIFIAIISFGLACAAPQKPAPSDVFSATFLWAETTPAVQDSFFIYANGNLSTRSDFFSSVSQSIATTYWQFYPESKEFVVEYEPYSCRGNAFTNQYQSFWLQLASATYVGTKTIQNTNCDYWESASETTSVSYCFSNGTLPIYFKQTWRNGDPISYYINNFVNTVDPNAFKVPCGGV